ncbi:MAG TPA: hypothetical protein VNU19_23855 [Candidatus Acidoferrum sp.]|nr:hypothetical protein [Candidatus Acidoferrum sp.]
MKALESSKFASQPHDIDFESDDLETFFRYAMTRGWGDGLPLVPPTRHRVTAMLAGVNRPHSETVATIAPAYGVATVEKIAINAVMAGCLPEHLPVVIAAVEACAAPEFNLYGIQATTNPAAPLVLVNGPIRQRLGFNSGGNALGQGNRANATVGRALRLVLINIGGGRPGQLDFATLGFPGKYTFCCAENEEANPWQPHHMTEGLPEEQSSATVFGIQALHNIVGIGIQGQGREVLRMIGMGMAAVGTNNMTFGGQALVLLCPEHAASIASEGFSKSDAAHFLYEHSRISFRDLPEGSRQVVLGRRARWLNDTAVTVADSPKDVQLVVVGGVGDHSVFAPSFGTTRSVTRAIRDGK